MPNPKRTKWIRIGSCSFRTDANCGGSARANVRGMQRCHSLGNRSDRIFTRCAFESVTD
jgi:hypothetical protein